MKGKIIKLKNGGVLVYQRSRLNNSSAVEVGFSVGEIINYEIVITNSSSLYLLYSKKVSLTVSKFIYTQKIKKNVAVAVAAAPFLVLVDRIICP